MRSGREPRVLARFPMHVGDSWTIGMPGSSPSVGEDGSAAVKAIDKIELPVRSLECYRIGYETTSGARNFEQRRTYTRWYCPAVKWFAKEVVILRTSDNFNPANNGEITTMLVLTKFTPGQWRRRAASPWTQKAQRRRHVVHRTHDAPFADVICIRFRDCGTPAE